MKIKLLPVLLLSLLGLTSVHAQDSEVEFANSKETLRSDERPALFKLDATARVDWQLDRQDGITDDANTGFKGKYLMLRMDGQIFKGFTYSWRQRLNKDLFESSWFNATDWIYVNYATSGWNFRVGKDVVAIGGWEYDAAPYNIYDGSVFWNNIACYQLGVSAGYNITPDDKLTAQITQSPMHTVGNSNMYAYNLMWNGHHGCFDAIYSANLLEYDKGRYINYLMLGNKFTFDKFTAEVDLMNRAARHQTFLFKDCSIVADFRYNPARQWCVFAKYSYDVNKSGTHADTTVLDGTELNMAGAGLEFYPIYKAKSSLRLHGGLFYSWGKNANTADPMQSKTLFATIGVTWHMNLLNIKKK